MSIRERSRGALDYPHLDETIVKHLTTVLGPYVEFHYVVLSPYYDNQIFGGIHETKAGADAAKAELISEAEVAQWGNGEF